MRIKIKRLINLFLIILLIGNNAFSQLYTFKNFNHRNGIPLARITALAEDASGIIWLGTDGAGIVRYDGNKFEPLKQSTKNNNHHITSLYISPDNEIYFSSRFQGFYKITKQKLEKISNGNNQSTYRIGICGFQNNLILVNETTIESGRDFGPKRIFNIESKVAISKANFLKVPKGVLIFTNAGNYFSDGNSTVSLSNYLGETSVIANQFVWGNFTKNKLILYDSLLTDEYHFTDAKNPKFFGKYATNINPQNRRVAAASGSNNQIVFGLEDGEIINCIDGIFKKIQQNYDRPLKNILCILVDRNEDYFVGTSEECLFKISVEPFSALKLHPLYKQKDIGFTFKTPDGRIVISTIAGKTSIGSMFNNIPFKNYSFRVLNQTTFNGKTLLATDQGIKQIDGLSIIDFKCSTNPRNKKVIQIFGNENLLFYCISDESLFKYDSKTDLTTPLSNRFPELPKFFYTAIKSIDSKVIYFGSNRGLWEYNIQTDSFKSLQSKFKPNIGGFIANAIIDKFQTIWFTIDYGLIAITKDGKYISIDDSKYFPSTLFYTLNSDKLGNIILGTNLGMNVLKINKYAKIIAYKNYSGDEGFEGYETHMRSQFQSGNSFIIGTIEGLFYMNTEVLEGYKPPAFPIISLNNRSITEKTIVLQDNKSYVFKFHINNPKSKLLQYSYRIAGEQQTSWSISSDKTEVFIGDLSGGNYNFEVRGTYNGRTFGEIGRFPFIIKTAFWKQSWFIAFCIFGIIGLNIYFLRRKKKKDYSHVFEFKSNDIEIKRPYLYTILYALVNCATYISSRTYDPSLTSFDTGIIAITILLILISIYWFLNEKKEHTRWFFKLIVVVIICFDLYSCIVTRLHPLPIFSLLINGYLISIFFTRLKEVLNIAIALFLSCVLIAILIKNPNTNPELFISITFGQGLILVIIYLFRQKQNEKLLFTSGIINQGNTTVVSFNSEGEIKFASDNIINVIGQTARELIGKPVHYLNKYTLVSAEYPSTNLQKDFLDGQVFRSPIITDDGSFTWWEWTCKEFSKNVRVILGNDITARLKAESNYKTLIDNANDLIFQSDVNGKFIFVNESCIKTLGYSFEEMIGKDSTTFANKIERKRIFEFYSEHFKSRKINSYFEFSVVTKSGKTIWLGQNITTLFKPNQTKFILGFLAIARDITTEKNQREQIEDQNSNITSSINYASRIQTNLFPGINTYRQSFGESFVFTKAKDIVSGDFHWMRKLEDRTILVLADCTGHGVPGSFMTLLGINLLNQIISENEQLTAGEILDHLDEKLQEIYPRDTKTLISDGMEATICVFEKNKLTFSQAGGNLLHSSDGQITAYRSKSKHIGDSSLTHISYATQEIILKNTDTIYLLTDGYQDQFGGAKDKKFGYKTLHNLIEQITLDAIILQKRTLENTFNEWKGNYPQTDDVTIVAIRNPIID